MNESGKPVADAEILAARPAKNSVDPRRPYAYFVEPERTAAGHVEDVATIFLTNRECPFHCLFCDLWKNTTDTAVPSGALPAQIDFALERLAPARHVKLYNSGNFFDAQAIPPSDHAAIADRLRTFATVIVENHPRLCSDVCLRFRESIGVPLEIAMGLETVHPQVLAALNKQMTLADFDRATRFLVRNGVAVRAFVLLRPPFLSEDEGRVWALRSIDHAFAAGAECCSVIPVRGGNGILERLHAEGQFEPPSLTSLEAVLQAGLELGRGRVFVDLWEAHRLRACPHCGPRRIERLCAMNLTQAIIPPVACDCGEPR